MNIILKIIFVLFILFLFFILVWFFFNLLVCFLERERRHGLGKVGHGEDPGEMKVDQNI